ncbi:hypothetical protein S245_010333, partial [Arachis hypogaea]
GKLYTEKGDICRLLVYYMDSNKEKDLETKFKKHSEIVSLCTLQERNSDSQRYSIDPDNMTYEELLELGEAVGTQSCGLTQEQISMLPVSSKYKCGFFSRKKSRDE